MSEKPFWYAFCPKDFLSDPNVQFMSTLEVGAYHLLLCFAWESRPPASVPDDDELLAKLCRMQLQEFCICKNSIMRAFALREDGRWYQKRLEQEYFKSENTRIERKKAAEKRWETAPVKKRMQKQCKSNAKAMQSECKSNANTTQYIKNPIVPFSDVSFADLELFRLRVCKLFKRGPETAWSESEMKTLRLYASTPEEDLVKLERYYSAKIAEDKDFRRTSMATLLNNFPSELDRARSFKPKQNGSSL